VSKVNSWAEKKNPSAFTEGFFVWWRIRDPSDHPNFSKIPPQFQSLAPDLLFQLSRTGPDTLPEKNRIQLLGKRFNGENRD